LLSENTLGCHRICEISGVIRHSDELPQQAILLVGHKENFPQYFRYPPPLAARGTRNAERASLTAANTMLQSTAG
jgi:hypothetical protein